MKFGSDSFLLECLESVSMMSLTSLSFSCSWKAYFLKLPFLHMGQSQFVLRYSSSSKKGLGWMISRSCSWAKLRGDP